MRTKITLIGTIILTAISNMLNAQIAEQNAENPCITETEYEQLQKLVAENGIKSPQFKTDGNTVSLEWPLKPAESLKDCSYYNIAAYVDHDANPGTFKDFNCGTNSYDGHRGTDIATWPFNFYTMDNDLVEVVAAAPGTIVAVHDGEFDRNCSSNNLTANYAMIQHSDGSTALYWHMKNGSVTTKIVGQTVVAGEHLGMVGSSGSASGPHLHFEVWAGADVSTRIDPYFGNCNILNNSSWWAAQKPAKETAVVKASVHTTDAVFPGCPNTETPNESNSYEQPFQGPGMTAGYAKFYIFIRDEVNGLVGNMSILNPDQSVYLSWTYNSATDTKTRTFAWSKKLPLNPGTYTYKATYNGITCSSNFDISLAAGIPTLINFTDVQVYPNPSNGKFIIEVENPNSQVLTVFNILGDKVLETTITNSKTEINLGNQSGVYFYQLKDNNEIFSTGKMVVK